MSRVTDLSGRPLRRIDAGSHEAAILQALIPAAGRWIEGDALMARISAPDNQRAHRLAARLVRWGVVHQRTVRYCEALLCLPREHVDIAQAMLDDARPVYGGPRWQIGDVPAWMAGPLTQHTAP